MAKSHKTQSFQVAHAPESMICTEGAYTCPLQLVYIHMAYLKLHECRIGTACTVFRHGQEVEVESRGVSRSVGEGIHMRFNFDSYQTIGLNVHVRNHLK